MNNDYPIHIFYSAEDDGYIADVPDLSGCSAFGESYEEAAREVSIAMAGYLEVARRHGDDIPPPSDLPTTEHLKKLSKVLKIAELARLAGINPHTLATKLRRNSELSEDESCRLLKAAQAEGIRLCPSG